MVNFVRGSLPAVLKKNGYNFAHCEFVNQIIPALEKSLADLIIIDLSLFIGMDYSVVRSIKADSRYNHIGILIIGNINNDSDIDLIFDSGINDFITHPVNFSELLIRANKILEEVSAHIKQPNNNASENSNELNS